MGTVCIYHSRDLDGWTSAAIVKKKYPETKLIGWDYGDEIPYIEPKTKVVMVDVSFKMETMLEIAKDSWWDLTWIDHHKSAIKDFNEFTEGGSLFA